MDPRKHLTVNARRPQAVVRDDRVAAAIGALGAPLDEVLGKLTAPYDVLLLQGPVEELRVAVKVLLLFVASERNDR